METVLQPVKNNSMNPLCLVPFQVEMFSNMAASPKIDDGWNLHPLVGRDPQTLDPVDLITIELEVS